jgi:adenylate cyclase
MAENVVRQRLAAILAADVAGYSRLMGDDEPATMDALDAARAVFTEHIEANQGRVVDTAGDSVLAVFETTEGAVLASVAIQDQLAEINEPVPDERRMWFRIGLHLGDIREKADGTVFGDGVNVAARLEGLADPGAIIVSDAVQVVLRDRLDIGFADAGSHEVKNVKNPVQAYRVLRDSSEGESIAFKHGATKQLRRPKLVVGLVAAFAVLIGLSAWWFTIRVEGPQMVTAEGIPTDDPLLAVPTGPAIAVLPLENLSEQANQDFFADGLTEDIITRLSRFPDFFVIARNSTNQYKGQAVDVRQVGRDLGARYVVEGSVRRSEETVRVTVRVLDAKTGTRLWSETYDRELTAANLFEVQDEITGSVASTIADEWGVLLRADIEAIKGKPTDSLDAYECVLRAIRFYDAVTPSEHLVVRGCLERAVEIDPNYATAWGWLANFYLDEYRWGFNPLPEPLDRALHAGRRAISLDADDEQSRAFLAKVYLFRGEVDMFSAEAEQAIALNPNNSSVLADIGIYTMVVGDLDRGFALVKKAVALNPKHPGWYYFAFAFYHYQRGEYELALDMALRVNLPEFFWTQIYLATIYGELGRPTEAREAVNALLALYPGFAEEFWSVMRKSGNPYSVGENFAEGLRKAGMDIPDRPEATE